MVHNEHRSSTTALRVGAPAVTTVAVPPSMSQASPLLSHSLDACYQLVAAYAAGKGNEGSIDWADVDAALSRAQRAVRADRALRKQRGAVVQFNATELATVRQALRLAQDPPGATANQRCNTALPPDQVEALCQRLQSSI